MVRASPLASEHTLFTQWALQRRIKLCGVAPCKIPGRGVGVVAQRPITAGEQLAKVPLSTLFTPDSVDKSFRNQHRDVTVHGLLASFLAFGNDDHKVPFGVSSSGSWRATWPTMKDFAECMPILWPQEALNSLPNIDFERLPPGIGGQWATIDAPRSRESPHSGLLHQQRRKLQADWRKVKALLPDADEETYTYFWLIVNTRSFYYIRPGTKIKPPQDDCMALCPFIDYFNHADEGCSVDFSGEGFVVTSDKAYQPGEEIFTSYGGHSNDLLLTEYGFILDENKWDSLFLDHLIHPHIDTEPVKQRLLEAGYLGNYNLSSSGLCFRTQVAIRAPFLDAPNFHRFVAGKPIEHNQKNTTLLAQFIGSEIIFKYWHEAQKALDSFETCDESFPKGIKEVLVKRWKQIQKLLTTASEHESQMVEDAF